MKKTFAALALILAVLVAGPATAGNSHNLVAVTTTATGTSIPTNGVCAQATVWSASTSSATVLFEQSADGTTWSTAATFTDPSSTATASAFHYAKFSRLRVSARVSGTLSGDIFWGPCTLFPTSITSFNNITFTKPATGATLTLTDGKTFSVAKTLTLTGTDGTTHTFPSTSATIARTDAGQTFTGTQVFGTATASRFLSTGTAPTVANVGADSCGTTAATIAGKDQAHVITVGATSGTECRVTFNVAFSNAPVCVATASVATDLHLVTTTTTATITGTLTAAEKIYVHCLGY